MKNLNIFKYLLLILFLPITSTYAQEHYLNVSLNSENAKPQKNGKLSLDPQLNSLFNEFEVTSYYQAFPGAKNPVSAKKYTIEAKGNIDSLLKRISALNIFERIEKTEYETTGSCNNPVSFNDPFHIQNSGYASTYQLDNIRAQCAWSITEGDSNLIVAVIDTEFEPNHEDMIGKFVSIDDPSPPGSPISCYHGTKVASEIAANNNNNKELLLLEIKLS